MPRALLIGATGTVGRAVAEVLCSRNWDVVLSARTGQRLDDLSASLPSGQVTTQPCSVESTTETDALADRCTAASLDAVVVTTAASWNPRPIAELDFDIITDVFERDLRLHVNAARTFIPRLSPGAVYLATGGGMADFTFPGMGPMSMTQAAQRALLRSWHKEGKTSGVHIRELLIAAMVRGHGPNDAREGSLTATEVAEHLVQVVENPLDNPGAVVTIDPSSRTTHSYTGGI
ncbi:SDR family NAD(P)-dependent oxidoreductase [Gordonia rubripertincta]|uniref:SDR family NAD(P)-dependent oxidoreductase n=1 Tax=Gordonia rubripertincta TaxID=36822 RepID=UPI000B8D552C|nr:SDR family oxidoreductase [Gordonia rubripertincta]ASR03141.1 short chain dehydrogenase [Gordonia rubripertincta]